MATDAAKVDDVKSKINKRTRQPDARPLRATRLALGGGPGQVAGIVACTIRPLGRQLATLAGHGCTNSMTTLMSSGVLTRAWSKAFE
jgi:hypothetical protein